MTEVDGSGYARRGGPPVIDVKSIRISQLSLDGQPVSVTEMFKPTEFATYDRQSAASYAEASDDEIEMHHHLRFDINVLRSVFDGDRFKPIADPYPLYVHRTWTDPQLRLAEELLAREFPDHRVIVRRISPKV